LSSRRAPVTRDRILSSALALFRKKGFDRTTMRDVASAAKTSLGAAYYYFPAKEAFVLAHWQSQMDEHERRSRAVFARTDDLTERVQAVFRTRIELMKNDRRLLAGLFRGIGDAESPVSVFGADTAPLRSRGIGLLREALEVDAVPAELRDAAALGLWIVMLAIVLYFIHDDSPGQARTRQLAGGAVALLVPLLPVLASGPASLWRAQLEKLLRDAGLWPFSSGAGG
jgi:AcrR family transcriptional regulator